MNPTEKLKVKFKKKKLFFTENFVAFMGLPLNLKRLFSNVLTYVLQSWKNKIILVARGLMLLDNWNNYM